MNRYLIAIVAVLVVALPALGQASEKPEPAWCGGSYSVTGGLDTKAYLAAAAADAYPSGTNFGECLGATYPETPASEVVFEGGKAYRVTMDAQGKEQRVELTFPPTREAAK